MTDNEIIKALECCTKDIPNCQECPYEHYCSINSKEHNVLKDTLDLINRQQAEIERLNNNISAMATTLSNSAKETRAEAIKEFTERLKTKKHECGCNYKKKPVYAVTEEKIDETYKEMVGDAE